MVSTPIRPTKRQKTVRDLPVLFKERNQQVVTKEQKIKAEIKQAYLGTARILTAHLELGYRLRDLRESFVEELMGEMREFPGHLYQPLCVIVNTLDNPESFREINANRYHYKVVGGSHNFTAANRLRLEMPGEEIFKTRNCCIYADTLSQEALTWLANRHNVVGESRRATTLLEKIKITRELLENSGLDQDKESRIEAPMVVLGKQHSKRVVQLLCSLAEMEREHYNLLVSMLTLHSAGKLKGQKLSQAEITHGPDVKPYVLSQLPSLPAVAKVRLLRGVIERETTLTELQHEARELARLQSVQRYFLDLMGLKRWEDAVEMYPTQTTRAALEHFTPLPLSRCPEPLKAFCRALKRKITAEETFDGEMGASGIFLNADAAELTEEAILQRVPDFPGADLVILDMPTEWSPVTLRGFLNFLTNLNINCQLEAFSVTVLCDVNNLQMVERSIKDTMHFEEPMKCFYMIPQKRQAPVLVESVFAMVIAKRKEIDTTSRHPLVWSSGHSSNFVLCPFDGPFIHNGSPVDEGQRPLSLYRELVMAMTTPGQFVMDVCSGTGTGTIVALAEGRNAIAIDKDGSMAEKMALRMNAHLKGGRGDDQTTMDRADEAAIEDSLDSIEEETLDDAQQPLDSDSTMDE